MMLHFIHGIHPKQPGGTVANLAPYFQNDMYYVHHYGVAYALTARWLNPGRADKIEKWVGPNDILIGHSNGCAIANAIAWKRSVAGLVMINPALDADTVFGPCEWVDVYYNEGDEAVPWAKLLWHHPWGSMGRDGYRGEFDSRITNINCGVLQEDWLPLVKGHGALFHEPCLEPWAKYIRSRIYDHINRTKRTP